MQVNPRLNLMVTLSRPNDLKPLHTSFSIQTKTDSHPTNYVNLTNYYGVPIIDNPSAFFCVSNTQVIPRYTLLGDVCNMSTLQKGNSGDDITRYLTRVLLAMRA